MPRQSLPQFTACFLGLALATSASAEDWQRLDETAIADALTGRKLIYDTAWQEFRASGRTLYNAGEDSWGTWTTRGNRYCSQWPPSATWNCFDVEQSADGTQIRFVGEQGDISTGTFAN